MEVNHRSFQGFPNRLQDEYIHRATWCMGLLLLLGDLLQMLSLKHWKDTNPIKHKIYKLFGLYHK